VIGFILFLVGLKIIDVPVIVNKTTTVDSIKVESSLRFFSKTFSNSTNKVSATSCPKTGRIIVTNDSVFGSESDLILSAVNVVFQSNLNLTGGNIFIDNCSTLESRGDINIIRGKKNRRSYESLLQQATKPFAVFLAIAEKLWLVLLFKNRKFYFAKDENWAKFNENSEFMERYTLGCEKLRLG
jgi:hypothetical protein